MQRGEDRVRIRRTMDSDAGHHDVRARPATRPTHRSRRDRPRVGPAISGIAPPPAANEHIVRSLRSSAHITTRRSPAIQPFVKVGDAVEPGQVLCIIESMKLMNEIESEVAGTVVAKLMENGRAVEYGEALFAIRPR